MGNLNKMVENELYSLRTETGCDFAALAVYDKRGRQISWAFASGNENERYKQMKGKPGLGISGMIVRHGRKIVLDETTPDLARKRMEYPIMLAENLQCAIAVPVSIAGETAAVLLCANRFPCKYTDEQISTVLSYAERIALFLQTNSLIR